jgi:hypothetical protein
MGDMVRVASSDSTPEPVNERAWHDGPGRGAYYVAARLAELESSGDGEVVSRACARCGELTGIEALDAAFAESCAGVLCTECSGTSSGILYIPSQQDL